VSTSSVRWLRSSWPARRSTVWPNEARAADAGAWSAAAATSALRRDDDSDHDQPIFPDRAKELVVAGRNQLWVADLTDVAIAVGFVYVAVMMDAWSHRIVGRETMSVLGRRIDARLTLAALNAAIALRRPPPSSTSTMPIAGPNTPLSAIGNASSRADSSARWAGVAILDDNAMMVNFMKTLKVEGVYPLPSDTAEDVVEQLPHFIGKYNAERLPALGYLSPGQFEAHNTRPPVKTAA
jgi:putative transposase